MSWIGKKAADVIASGQQLANGTVTAIKLAAGAVVAHLGYTPVNKAGDAMTGGLTTTGLNIQGEAYPQMHILSSVRDWVLFNNSYGGTGGTFVIKDNTLSTDRLIIDTGGRVQIPNQPYASWTVSCISPSNTRTYALRSNIGSCTSIIGAAQGSNPGSIVKFTAPIAGRYLVTVTASQAGTNSPTGGTASCLISAFGSWSGSSNSVQPGQEIIDTRSARGLDDVGNSFILNLAQGDHIEPDFYTSYESGGKIDVTVQLIS